MACKCICPMCAGHCCEPALKPAYEVMPEDDLQAFMLDLVPCWYCGGTGKVDADVGPGCRTCNGPTVQGACLSCSRFFVGVEGATALIGGAA